MPVLAYVHPLVNVDQCHAYLHTLRWKERSLPCPRWQRQDVAPGGNEALQEPLAVYRTCAMNGQGLLEGQVRRQCHASRCAGTVSSPAMLALAGTAQRGPAQAMRRHTRRGSRRMQAVGRRSVLPTT
jgi:hypothetical protein